MPKTMFGRTKNRCTGEGSPTVPSTTARHRQKYVVLPSSAGNCTLVVPSPPSATSSAANAGVVNPASFATSTL